MSDITAEEWSEKAVQNLRHYEQHCPDEELFFIGYLIPLVERVELEWPKDAQSSGVWNQRYIQYVHQCIEEDSVSEQDKAAIENLAQSLIG